jgi:hypothetical protein
MLRAVLQLDTEPNSRVAVMGDQTTSADAELEMVERPPGGVTGQTTVLVWCNNMTSNVRC